MPYLLRNPIYHWSHLELARYFGLDDLLLDGGTAQRVWDHARERLAEPGMSARGLLDQSNVRLVCTTDDPSDTLEHHRAMAADPLLQVQVLPTWRIEIALQIERTQPWNAWVDRLAKAADVNIDSLDDFLEALQRRHDFFEASGCKLADYGLETVHSDDFTESEAAAAFLRARAGGVPSVAESRSYHSAMMLHFGRMDAASGWSWQMHSNVIRNNNPKMFQEVGPDAGFDSIGDTSMARGLARLFGRLELEGNLPRTVIYTLNPGDYEVVATMIGNFQGAPTPGRMQLGSAWWFNDQKDGIERHIEAVSQLGLISRFVGMLTDSRSFLSFARHEYFRRILCNIFGGDIERGLVPRDFGWVGSVIRDICYNNAANYFGFAAQLEADGDAAR
jgi:glucuronate isomerase